MPVFALANAGVSFAWEALGGIVSDPITAGVILGLLVGKTAGVFGATALAVRLGIGRLPAGTTWHHVGAISVVAGVGFTVALFVTSLSFDDPSMTDAAKVGILAGSSVAGLIGYLVLRAAPTTAIGSVSEPRDRAASCVTDAVAMVVSPHVVQICRGGPSQIKPSWASSPAQPSPPYWARAYCRRAGHEQWCTAHESPLPRLSPGGPRGA